MSSSLDAGHYANEAIKAKETPCKTSPSGSHSMEKHGLWPSTWWKCTHCSLTTYSK